jgi:p-cumate 2,3-dioxygenase beta subunit
MTTLLPSGMTLGAIGRAEVEDLLYLEAQLLDEWQLEEWLTLFTADARYVMPTNDNPDGDPLRHLMLVDDDFVRMQARVVRLSSRRAHREYPHARTSHQTTNVRIVHRGSDDGSDELRARAAFTVWRFREGRADYYVGTYHYTLRLVEGALRIATKRVVMDMTTLRPAGAVSVIL